MTTITAFVDQTAHELRSSISGTAVPSIKHNLCTWLALKLAFVKGGEILALPDGMPVSMVIKPWGSPDAAPVALDVTADVTGAGDARRYLLKALVDGEALRALLGGKEFGEFALQVAWGVAGEEDYDETFPLKISLVTSYFRSGDAVPEPLTDAGWAKIKAFFPEGGAIVHDDGQKIIQITGGGGGGGGGSWGGITGTLESQTDLAAALNAKVPTARTVNGHALSGNVTVSKSDVGLGNCDNTSDADKPVSTAVAAAIAAALAAAAAPPLVRVHGTLQGYTNMGSPATAPAPFVITITGSGSYVINGVTFTVGYVDPEDGSIFCDASSSLSIAASAMATLGAVPGLTGRSSMGDVVTLERSETGAASTITVNDVTHAGTDEVFPSGEVMGVDLYAVPLDKTFRPVAAYMLSSSDLGGVLRIISPFGVMAETENAALARVLVPGAQWTAGAVGGHTIRFELDAPVVPEGGSATVELIGELVNP